MVDAIIGNKVQVWGVPELEHMIAQNNLVGQLNAFLLSCKLEELSPATIRITKYQDVTASNIRLFLLNLDDREMTLGEDKNLKKPDRWRKVKNIIKELRLWGSLLVTIILTLRGVMS